jgi:hypothetical protein
MKGTIRIAALCILAAAAVCSVRAQDAPQTGSLKIEAYTHRGPVAGFAELLKLDSESGEFYAVTKKPLLKGTLRVEGLPVGAYKIVITTSEEIEPQVDVIDNVAITAGERADRKVRFKQATVEVLARDSDNKPLDGCVVVRRLDESDGTSATLPAKIMVADGKASFYVAPAKYEVTFIPDDIIGCRGISETITLQDAQTQSVKPTVSFGWLAVESRNFAGPVPSRLVLYASGVNGRKPEPLSMRSFDGKPMKVRVLPGRYAVDIEADSRAILPSASSSFDAVEISESKERHVAAYFECAKFRLDLSAHGRVDARLEMQRWNEEMKSFAAFHSLLVTGGATEMTLGAGKYRFIVVDQTVSPQEPYTLDEFVLVDCQTAARSLALKRGEICLVARLAPDAPPGVVEVFRREGKVERRILLLPLTAGETVLPLAEGEYRVITTVGEGASAKRFAGAWRTLTERARLMEVLKLGAASAAALPPDLAP